VVLDPISNLISVGLINEVNSMLLRLIDFLQGEGITVVMTSLTDVMEERINEGVSSLVDTWISVKEIEANGERNKFLYVRKSRDMKHSNQVRELIISDAGLELAEIYIGPSGVLVGSERRERKLQKLRGTDLKSQQLRGEMARRRQEDGIPHHARQKRRS